MGDAQNIRESVKVRKSLKKRISLSRHRHLQKNACRRIRKKRNKVRYYQSLKKLRYSRRTDDLCSAVQVFDITDMEWTPSCSSSTALPTEVTEWQKQEQIAYWKSRAISLELENKMLHQHLRNVYAKTIEDYSQMNQYSESNSEESTENQLEENRYKRHRSLKKTDTVDAEKRVSPREPRGKNRMEEMKKMYGDPAQKIMGMETALQLSFEKHLDQLNPPYWPSMPLRLKFD